MPPGQRIAPLRTPMPTCVPQLPPLAVGPQIQTDRTLGYRCTKD